jgi:hypothetical protein
VLLEYGYIGSVEVSSIPVVEEGGIAQDIFLHSTQECRRIVGKAYPLSLSNVLLMPLQESSSIFINVEGCCEHIEYHPVDGAILADERATLLMTLMFWWYPK